MAQTPPNVRDEDFPEPPRLRRLRLMVTALLMVLMAGVVIVVAALVISIGSLGGGEGAQKVAAEAVALPAGETVEAVGEGPGVLILTTSDGEGAERLRRFDAVTGEALSVTEIRREE